MSQRSIIHVDMDAFFASVEQQDNPALRGKPVIVGHGSKRGVVAAASYEARAHGVHSAMPMATAMRRCPQAKIIAPRMARYSEVSEIIFGIFHKYTPLVEGLSVDEAFLDVTGSRRLFGDSMSIAAAIRSGIKETTGLTASAGIAPNKFVAKIASDLDKPDGLVVVADESVQAFLAPLPIDRMWGVGGKTAQRLRSAGIETLGDLADCSEGLLTRLLGNQATHFRQLAKGLDDRPVQPAREAKSVGGETTFREDLRTLDEIETHLLAQCRRVAKRLEAKGVWASLVSVKLKSSRHKSRSKQKRVDPLRDTDSLFAVARQLLSSFDVSAGVRLVGVQAGDLTTSAHRSLFDDGRRQKGERIEALSAALDERFGDGRITRARLLKAPRERSPAIKDPSVKNQPARTEHTQGPQNKDERS